MQRIFIFGIICLMICQVSVSQKVTVSDEIPLRNDLAYDLVGKIDSSIILFRDRGSKYEIKIYDDNLKHREEKEILLADRQCTLLATLTQDSTFFVMYGFRSKGNYYIQADQFNSRADVISSDTIKIYKEVFFNPDVKATYSEDKSKVLFFSIQDLSDMQTAVFDLYTRSTLVDRKVIFRDTDLKDDFRKMLVTNKGDIIIIFEKNNFKSKRDKHVFEVHRMMASSDVNFTFIIPVFRIVSFHSKFLYDNVNNRLVGGGIYSAKQSNKAEGIFLIQHDLAQGATEKVQAYPFENKLDEEIKRRSKDKNEFNHLEVSDIALKQDGGLVLITEIKKEYERRAGFPGGGLGNRTIGGNPYAFRSPLLVDYYYEDMAVFSIAKDGSLEWSDVLHKKQYSHDDDAVFSSFFLFKNPSRLRLVYNDEISTENTVSEYVIQANGQYQRKSVLSTEYVRLQLRFKDAIQISSNAFIVPSQRNLRLNLVKVEYL